MNQQPTTKINFIVLLEVNNPTYDWMTIGYYGVFESSQEVEKWKRKNPLPDRNHRYRSVVLDK